MNIFEENKNKNTRVESLGEFGLIDYLTKEVKLDIRDTLLGIVHSKNEEDSPLFLQQGNP